MKRKRGWKDWRDIIYDTVLFVFLLVGAYYIVPDLFEVLMSAKGGFGEVFSYAQW